MMRLFRIWWYAHKVRRAKQDLEFFREEVVRCTHNVDIAKYGVDYWTRQLYYARYPVPRGKLTGDNL